MADVPIILSLGAGVQSSTILLMACKGILPKPDAAIFADTHAEPPHVYTHLWWLAEEAQKAGIPVRIESKGNLKADALRSTMRGTFEDDERAISLPVYTKMRGQTEGRIQRQCTKEYKIDLLKRIIREDVLGVPRHGRVPHGSEVIQWIGISWDEQRRMRVSDNYYITNSYPLIGWPHKYLEEPWTRNMCKAWFAEHYPGRSLARSSCIFCPMHSDAEWIEMRAKRPKEWREAIEFDCAMRRRGGEQSKMYLHRSCVPLAHVAFKKPEKTQTSFSCMGMCDT